MHSCCTADLRNPETYFLDWGSFILFSDTVLFFQHGGVQAHSRCAVHISGELHERMVAVKLQAEHVMAGIVALLCDTLAKCPQHLTDAVRSVFMEAPEQLAWEQCGDLTGCFVAESPGERSDVYTVNLMTGAAMCNGQDPSHLPGSIVNHPVYQAVFPSVLFDVTPKVVGEQVTYRTVHAISRCFYSWRLENEQLLVIETCNDEALELLPCAHSPTLPSSAVCWYLLPMAL